MTDSVKLHTLLDQVTRLAGVAQAFCMLPDRTILSASAPGQPTRDDEAWVALADTLDTIEAAVDQPREVLWTFNHWCVLLCKSNQYVFGALIEKQAADKSQAQVRALLNKAGLK